MMARGRALGRLGKKGAKGGINKGRIMAIFRFLHND